MSSSTDSEYGVSDFESSKHRCIVDLLTSLSASQTASIHPIIRASTASMLHVHVYRNSRAGLG